MHSPVDVERTIVARAIEVDRDRPVTVAVAPGWHPVLRRLRADETVHQLPGLDETRHGTGRLDAWTADVGSRADLLHVAVTGRRTDRQLERVLAGLAAEVPTVVTVLELHHRGRLTPRADVSALMDVLERASAVTTLTHAAAAEIETLTGHAPVVIGHPHVVPMERIERMRTEDEHTPTALRPQHRVGMVLSRGTGRLAAWEAATALSELLGRDAVAQVEVLSVDHVIAADLGDHPLLHHSRCRVRHVPSLSEGRLLRWVARMDALLLPYRHATHSSWIPLCADLMTATVSVGSPAMLELGLTAGYAVGSSGLVEPDGLADAVVRALGSDLATPDADRRRAELKAICDAYRTVYGQALAESPLAMGDRGLDRTRLEGARTSRTG